MVGPDAEKNASVTHFSAMFVAGAQLRAPVGAIVLRKGYGLGVWPCSPGTSMLRTSAVAWPTGELGGMGLEGAVRLAARKELAAIADPAERKRVFDELVARAYEHGQGHQRRHVPRTRRRHRPGRVPSVDPSAVPQLDRRHRRRRETDRGTHRSPSHSRPGSSPRASTSPKAPSPWQTAASSSSRSAAGRLSQVSPDGSVSTVAEVGGGPNGAAIGPDGAVYIANCGGFLFLEDVDGSPTSTGMPSADYGGGSIQHVTSNRGGESCTPLRRPAAGRTQRPRVRRARRLLLHRQRQDLRRPVRDGRACTTPSPTAPRSPSSPHGSPGRTASDCRLTGGTLYVALTVIGWLTRWEVASRPDPGQQRRAPLR